MKSSKLLVAALTATTAFSIASASGVDMDDPRRALGREDDIRVDAQLLTETVASGAPIGVRYQIHNLSKEPVAVAEKRCEASYDPDTQMITVSLGAEVPVDGAMPRMAIVGPGEKKTFTAGVVLRLPMPSVKSMRLAQPRLVQLKVNVLRDLKPFEEPLRRQQQTHPPASIPLSDEQFEKWLEGNEAIFLNAIPVHFDPSRSHAGSAESGARPGMFTRY